MIIPTLNCPSNCKYCWGSENKNEMMDIEIIDQIITWLGDFISLSMEENLCLQDMTFIKLHSKNYQNWIILKGFLFKATFGFYPKSSLIFF